MGVTVCRQCLSADGFRLRGVLTFEEIKIILFQGSSWESDDGDIDLVRALSTRRLGGLPLGMRVKCGSDPGC